MSLLARRYLGGAFSPVQSIRTVYGRSRIGYREVVGFGINGGYNYKDDVLFPFPAIRFQEPNDIICYLRQRELCDWRTLSIDEKKALYRASFCQTFVEFLHPTGQYKFILGWVLIIMSFGWWAMIFVKMYVNDPLPESFSPRCQAHQLRRMLELRVNPIDGISSKWDYAKDTWKE